jgi:hypothetical protein
MKIHLSEKYREPWAWSTRLALNERLLRGDETITLSKEELDAIKNPILTVESSFVNKEEEVRKNALWICRLLTERGTLMESMRDKTDFSTKEDEFVFVFQKPVASPTT